MSVYSDVLRGMSLIDKTKNIQFQILEHKKITKASAEEKINEFLAGLTKEVAQMKDAEDEKDE